MKIAWYEWLTLIAAAAALAAVGLLWAKVGTIVVTRCF